MKCIHLIATLICFLCSPFSHQLLADDQPKMRLKDKLFFGGGVTLSFGNITVAGASPIIGYKINKRLSAGVGLEYLYYRERWQRNGPVYQTSIYGANGFGRYVVSDNLFAHAEYGFTNWELPVFDPVAYRYTTERRNVPFFLMGGGFMQPVGERSAVVIMALYDVLYNASTSPNPSPLIFRAGINIGF